MFPRGNAANRANHVVVLSVCVAVFASGADFPVPSDSSTVFDVGVWYDVA